MQCKYLFFTGGVCSSLGKGISAASIGLLLERKGMRIALLKLDPYLNIDPGTMNPFQHGEVYITDDGAETDLDLGHYQRFTTSPLSRFSNATAGQIYHTVIKQERRGAYLGTTVQVIPHITDEIKQRIRQCAKQDLATEVVLVEVGGTVGDIESLPFLEAIRQFRNEHAGHCLNIHLTYVPYIKAAGEVKTKPTQHSVQMLRQIGLFPDIILCRCEKKLDESVKAKISLFCDVQREAVVDEPDVLHTVYEVPLALKEQKVDNLICRKLGLPESVSDLSDWQELVDSMSKERPKVTVAVVGKYVQHQDAYKSVMESLHHAALANGYGIEIRPIEAETVVSGHELDGCDGCLVPGGFGERGWEGKVRAAKSCREGGKPYFGICLGMQVMAVEFARHVLGLEGANTTEIDSFTPHPIISLLSEQASHTDMGGTMRLGLYTSELKPKTRVHSAYNVDSIQERHRHRYEFNNQYREACEKNGMTVAALLTDGDLCEALEIENHPWMVGVQFHPEFLSKPTAPHPLFKDFVRAMIQYRHQRGG